MELHILRNNMNNEFLPARKLADVSYFRREIYMGQLIKKFKDGTFLEYDKGSFDDWCVYFTDCNGKRKPPRDIDYFSDLISFANTYGTDKVYGDYSAIYDMTGKQVSNEVLSEISKIAISYGSDSLSVDKIFSILHMAMVAEEQKENTRLGKRIKRLGIHKLLIEGASVTDAANFMKGMGWRDIDRLCKERGF